MQSQTHWTVVTNSIANQYLLYTRVIVINSNFTANQGNSLQISNSESVTVNESSFRGNCLSASGSLVIINENRLIQQWKGILLYRQSSLCIQLNGCD